ncbi:MAG: hypothetical protein ACKVIQ_01495 [Acidimicrobiales bacterium]
MAWAKKGCLAAALGVAEILLGQPGFFPSALRSKNRNVPTEQTVRSHAGVGQ